jgi:hypothetical protein
MTPQGPEDGGCYVYYIGESEKVSRVGCCERQRSKVRISEPHTCALGGVGEGGT